MPKENVIKGMFNMIDNSTERAIDPNMVELEEEEEEEEGEVDEEDPEHTVGIRVCGMCVQVSLTRRPSFSPPALAAV